MADSQFVTFKRLHDPVQAELLIGLLEQSGIPVTSTGLNHRAMLGFVGSYVEITIQVPADRLDEARELVEALEAEGEDAAVESASDDEATDSREDDEATDSREDEGDEPENSESGVPGTTRRLKRVAVFAAIALTFGGGHFYARNYGRGLVLLVSEALCLFLALSGTDTAALYALPLVIIADIVGSLEAVDRFNEGRAPTGTMAILGRTLPWIAPVLVIAPLALRLSRPDVYVATSGRTVCELTRHCGGEEAAQCIEGLAGRLGRGEEQRSRIDACAECATGRSCEALYESRECNEEAVSSDDIFAGALDLGLPETDCEPQTVLRPRCRDACSGVLPERRASARLLRDMPDPWRY